MFLPNDKTALCSGQPWKSCRRLGSTPGLPAASLPAAHPRAAAAVRGPRRPSRFRGPGTRRARGTVPLRQVERAATPGRARRSVGEELRKGKAPPAGEGIPSARRSRPPAPAPSCSEAPWLPREWEGRKLGSSLRHRLARPDLGEWGAPPAQWPARPGAQPRLPAPPRPARCQESPRARAAASQPALPAAALSGPGGAA